MKLKNNYAVTKLADENIAVPLDNTDAFHGIIKLNESGAEIFRLLNDGNSEEETVEKVKEKYSLDEATAKKAVAAVIKTLSEAGLME